MYFLEQMKEKHYPSREAIIKDLDDNGYLILAEEQPPEVLSECVMDNILIEDKCTYSGRYVLYLSKDVDNTTGKECWYIAEIEIPD